MGSRFLSEFPKRSQQKALTIERQGRTRTTTGRALHMATSETNNDLLYLFGCCLTWRRQGDLGAYQDLVAALDDSNSEVQMLADSLLRRFPAE